jgi:CubicO group peptidase (beta-lactamase class C family)
MKMLFAIIFLCLSMITSTARADSVDDAIQAEMKRQAIPGMAIAVMQDGKITRLSSYGMANLELKVPVTPDTLFQTGSTGKQFASLAILMLEKEGKLSTADKLSKYFPDVPKSWADIRLKHLLSHTSGLDDNDAMYDLQKTMTSDALRKMNYRNPKTRAAGKAWAYSNVGYQLLGMVIEKVTGAPYHRYLDAQIFKPLGMIATRDISEEDIIPNRASGYERKDGKLGEPLKNQSWVSSIFNRTADGSTYITARDYGAYLMAMDAPPSNLKPLWEEATTPVVAVQPGKPVTYGMGWFLATVDGVPIRFHTGSWQGFRAYIVHYPTKHAGMVMLVNSDTPEKEQLLKLLTQKALPGMPAPPQ